MTMIINTNSAARERYNVLYRNKRSLDDTIGELSSGLRIKEAADDSAGLSISEKMRAQIYGYDQAAENSQDGLSMLQTAEGGLGEIQSIMQRMRDLAVQGANDTLTALDRSYVQFEFGELRNEINHIAETAEFNGKKLLNGDAGALWSSSDLETKAIINGGIYGYEGNYEISVKASVGDAEIQKTNIFTLRQDTVMPWYVTVHTGNGIAAPSSQTPPSVNTKGTYTVSAQTFALTLTEDSTGVHNSTASVTANTSSSGNFTVTPDADLDVNADIVFTVDSVSDTGDVTFSYSGSTMDKSGVVSEGALSGSMTITSGTAQSLTIGTKSVNFDFTGSFNEGDKIAVNLAAQAVKADDDIVFTVKGDLDAGSMGDHHYTLAKSAGSNTTLDFNIALKDKDGELEQGTVHLTTDSSYAANIKDTTLAVFQRGGTMPESSNTLQTVQNQSVLQTEIQNLPAGASATVKATVDRTSSNQANEYKNYGRWYLLQRKPANGTLENLLISNSEGVDILATKQDRTVIRTEADQSYGILQGFDGTASMNVSGILKMTIGGATGGTTLDDANVWLSRVEFWGTHTNGEAVHVDQTLTASTGRIPSTSGDANASRTRGLNYDSTTGTACRIGNVRLFDIDALNSAINNGKLQAGDEFYIQVVARSGTAGTSHTGVTLSLDGDDGSGGDIFTYTPRVVLDEDVMKNTSSASVAYVPYTTTGSLDLSTFNWDNALSVNLKILGTSTDGSITDADISALDGATLVDYDFGTNAVNQVDRVDAAAGDTAIKTSRIRDLKQFYDANDKFLLDDPKTITITQGDGRNAKVTLYADDTLEDVETKLNAAIANELGQAKYVKSGDEENFVNFVTESNAKDNKNTPESVAGTMVIHSAIAGQAGRLSFSGDEDVLNAFGLNTLQQASETTYTVNISNAHTGSAVLTDAKLTGNRLIGAITPNVDIEFDRMAGTKANWDDKERDFNYETKEYNTILHLADNTTTLQIGSNEGDIMQLNIGSMKTDALNLDAATLATRESSKRAITMLDTAIDKVAMQRAKIGAMESRIEHHIASITTSHENLANAESRIRDADMAKASVKFAKLQIMMQANISINAQANQAAQSVLNLMR
ncbi:MAG: hypothetical protein IJ667_04840 [Synergistaceae bacterium]|nr:hypothetical protein [Synergistaceae bacterium]